MTEKQENRAWSLIIAALADDFEDRHIVTEKSLLYNAEGVEPLLEKFDGEKKKIRVFSLITAAIMKNRCGTGNTGNLSSFADKIEKFIEEPEKHTTKT